MEPHIIIIITAIVILGSLVFYVSTPSPGWTSQAELDEIACEQMRADGWTEEEIETFMDNHDGWYFPPKD